MYLSMEAATSLLSRSPRLGAYVVEIEIADNSPARIEQSGRNAQHMTVWAAPEYLMEQIVSITREPGLN
jgi:hypothetical protein